MLWLAHGLRALAKTDKGGNMFLKNDL